MLIVNYQPETLKWVLRLRFVSVKVYWFDYCSPRYSRRCSPQYQLRLPSMLPWMLPIHSLTLFHLALFHLTLFHLTLFHLTLFHPTLFHLTLFRLRSPSMLHSPSR